MSSVADRPSVRVAARRPPKTAAAVRRRQLRLIQPFIDSGQAVLRADGGVDIVDPILREFLIGLDLDGDVAAA